MWWMRSSGRSAQSGSAAVMFAWWIGFRSGDEREMRLRRKGNSGRGWFPRSQGRSSQKSGSGLNGNNTIYNSVPRSMGSVENCVTVIAKVSLKCSTTHIFSDSLFGCGQLKFKHEKRGSFHFEHTHLSHLTSLNSRVTNRKRNFQKYTYKLFNSHYKIFKTWMNLIFLGNNA